MASNKGRGKRRLRGGQSPKSFAKGQTPREKRRAAKRKEPSGIINGPREFLENALDLDRQYLQNAAMQYQKSEQDLGQIKINKDWSDDEIDRALKKIDPDASLDSINKEMASLRSNIKDTQSQIEFLSDVLESGTEQDIRAAYELLSENESWKHSREQMAQWSREDEQQHKADYHKEIISDGNSMLDLSEFKPQTPGLQDLIRDGGPATYEDYQQILEEEAERNKAFKGAKTAEQYQANKLYSGGRRTEFNDPVLQMRWDKVKDDIGGMDCADILFEGMRTKQRNTNVCPFTKTPGERGDIGNIYPEDGKKQAHQYVMDLLRKAKPFAFPSWWFSESSRLWEIRHMHIDTHDYPEQFPICGTKEYQSAWSSFMKSLSGVDKPFSRITDRIVLRNANIGFPENTPFSNTFIGLENPDEMLIYQRVRNQTDMVRNYMSPTSAVSPDGHIVALDAIYAAGFLFSKDIDFKMNNVAVPDFCGSAIWGVYLGYVFSHRDCPSDMDFLRIPMIVPLYLTGIREWQDGAERLWKDTQPHKHRFNDWFQQDTNVASPLNHLMQAIDDHSVVQVEFTHSQKRQKRKLKAREGISVSHKRYSRVQMTGGVVMPSRGYSDSEPTGMLPKWKLDHRVDCREHDRCYIRRGRLPISSDERSLLEGRGYTIYTDRKDVSPRDARRFNRRRIPHPDGIDWVAIKTVRIPEHKRGPEGKRVVPLVRVTKDEVIGDSLEYELSDPLKAV